MKSVLHPREDSDLGKDVPVVEQEASRNGLHSRDAALGQTAANDSIPFRYLGGNDENLSCTSGSRLTSPRISTIPGPRATRLTATQSK